MRRLRWQQVVEGSGPQGPRASIQALRVVFTPWEQAQARGACSGGACHGGGAMGRVLRLGACRHGDGGRGRALLPGGASSGGATAQAPASHSSLSEPLNACTLRHHGASSDGATAWAPASHQFSSASLEYICNDGGTMGRVLCQGGASSGGATAQAPALQSCQSAPKNACLLSQGDVPTKSSCLGRVLLSGSASDDGAMRPAPASHPPCQ